MSGALLAMSLAMLISVGCQGGPAGESDTADRDEYIATPGVLASEATPIDPPAVLGSMAPALAAERDRILERDFLLMTWLEPDTGTHPRLRFARFSGEAWSAPYTVIRGVAATPDDAPFLAAVDTDTGRATLVARTGSLVAQSSDGGRIWRRLRTPALGFASLVGGFEETHVFWLAAGAEGSATLWGGPAFADETVLDPRVSAGCATTTARTSDGPVVVYRDRSQDDVRDIAIVRLDGERWTAPDLVHTDGWRPVNGPLPGPAVAARDQQVIVAWYTAAQRRPRLLVAFSSDAGATFAEPIEMDRPVGIRTPSGSVSIAIDEDGHALVLWVTSDRGGESTLLLSRVAADGRRGDELVLAKMPAHRLRSVPQTTPSGEHLAVAWEEGGTAPGVRAVIIPVDAIAKPTNAVPSGGRGARARVGEPAPPLETTSLAGKKVSLASLLGRPVVLNVWATWCGPCREELPELAKLHERHGPEGLVVVGVSVDAGSSVDEVRTFVVEQQIPFAIWLDPEENFSRAFGVRGVPATFVLDRKGRVLFRSDRPVTADDPEFTRVLARVLE